ncbi:galactokinase, partial [Oenococcus oeni]
PGVLGARMIGAGFGGCAIAIVGKDYVDDFKTKVGKSYQEKIGYPADFYIAKISDGPKEIVE